MDKPSQIDQVRTALGEELFSDIRSCIYRVFDAKNIKVKEARQAAQQVNSATLNSLAARAKDKIENLTPQQIVDIIAKTVRSERADFEKNFNNLFE